MQKNLVSTIDTKSNVIVPNIEKHQKESNEDFSKEQRELLQSFEISFDKLDIYEFFVYVFFISKKHAGT